MAAEVPLRLVLVTPETTLVDEPVSALRFPLYDGQIGILPAAHHSSAGSDTASSKVTHVDGSNLSYFIDGGFVQVKENIVSLLTDRCPRPATKSTAPPRRRSFAKPSRASPTAMRKPTPGSVTRNGRGRCSRWPADAECTRCVPENSPNCARLLFGGTDAIDV